MTLNITATLNMKITSTLNSEIIKWRKYQRVRIKRRSKENINKVICMLLKSDLSCFTFDDQSIEKICVASSIAHRPSDETAELLEKLKGVCDVSEESCRSLLSHIVERLKASTIIFYVEHLIDFGIDSQSVCDYVYEKIFQYTSRKPNIREEHIGPILQSLRDKGFVATSSGLYNILLSIIASPHPAEAVTCLKYLDGVDYTDMSEGKVKFIFDRCIRFRQDIVPLPVIKAFCRLNLVPDSAFVLQILVERIAYLRMTDQKILAEILCAIITYRPVIIQDVIQMQTIIERYDSWNKLCPTHFIPAEYILMRIDDDYYVQQDDTKLYGIQWNPIVKQLENVHWHACHYWDPVRTKREELLRRYRRLFDQVPVQV